MSISEQARVVLRWNLRATPDVGMTAWIGASIAFPLAAVPTKNTGCPYVVSQSVNRATLDLATSLLHSGIITSSVVCKPSSGQQSLAGNDSVEGMLAARVPSDRLCRAGRQFREMAHYAPRHRPGLARKVIDHRFEETRAPIEFAVGYLTFEQVGSRRRRVCGLRLASTFHV